MPAVRGVSSVVSPVAFVLLAWAHHKLAGDAPDRQQDGDERDSMIDREVRQPGRKKLSERRQLQLKDHDHLEGQLG